MVRMERRFAKFKDLKKNVWQLVAAIGMIQVVLSQINMFCHQFNPKYNNLFVGFLKIYINCSESQNNLTKSIVIFWDIWWQNLSIWQKITCTKATDSNKSCWSSVGQNYCFAEAGTTIATTPFEKSTILAEMGDQLGKKEQSGGIVDSPPKPCPFGSGLKKFAFDPAIVILVVWSSCWKIATSLFYSVNGHCFKFATSQKTCRQACPPG